MSIRNWFKRAKVQQEQTSDAQRYFRKAVSQIGAGNEPEALLGFSRVLQLMPDNEQALVWREKLARELGLDELDRAARVMERFAYSHCGPGIGWKVELREMYAFRPRQRPEPYEAALLDLCQTPPVFIELTIAATEYKVRLMADRPVPGVSRTCLSEVKAESIPATEESLMELLKQFLSANTLVVRDKQLRYAPR